MSPWNYMPSDEQIEQLQKFIKNYYKKRLYLNIFNSAVKENKLYIKRFEQFQKSIKKL